MSLPHPPEMISALRSGPARGDAADTLNSGSEEQLLSSQSWGGGDPSQNLTGEPSSLDESPTHGKLSAEVPDGLRAWVPNRATEKLVSFIDAAADHLRDLQVIDNARFDVATRKLTFLMYRSTAQGRDGDAHVLLLDASRGMQAIAAPIPVSALRPCTL